jgi:hypothetical protein
VAIATYPCVLQAVSRVCVGLMVRASRFELVVRGLFVCVRNRVLLFLSRCSGIPLFRCGGSDVRG